MGGEHVRSTEELYQELLAAFAQRAGFTPEEGCDLAGYAVKALGQIIALNLQHTILGFLQTLLQETGNQICNPHLMSIPFRLIKFDFDFL